MGAISFEDGRIEVDAALVAKALQMEPEALRAALRSGAVTSQCETGMDEDAGRFRLTFFSATRRLRLTVAASGEVLQTSTADYRRKPGP
ncbi:DUF6522 family protein [Frigidibacter mobilis]|uniref:PepSY domain-containing protein n=1 Tax=Frigidibacter mobilis TaxID=1335048 RepID=A0A159Z163_9RHOB|nr:DUF6522 family protein [Frigidibacter mobilis]AMY68641.1 hypothetical protein AKL17_1386 [Frigidibacter mobilis]